VNHPSQSGLLVRSLTALALVLGVIISLILVSALAFRTSLLYLCLSAALVVPIAYLMSFPVRRVCLLLVAVALALAISPVDYVVRHTGRPRVRLLPIFYGRAPNARPEDTQDTEWRGCVVPLYPPMSSVVVEY